LVAPVFTYSGEVSYYLPDGVWTNWLTGEVAQGGSWRTETHAFDSIPLWVRDGSIVVTNPGASKPDRVYGEDAVASVFLNDASIETASATVSETDGSSVVFTARRTGAGIEVSSSDGRAFRARLGSTRGLGAAGGGANKLGGAGYQAETPCDGYKGAYINEIAARVEAEAKADGVNLTALAHQDQGLNDDGEPLGEDDTEVREEFRKRAVPMMFDEIQKSMKDFRVNFDVWFHENSLYADKKVEAAIEELKSHGDIYDKDGATWFESTKHGDDKDRVIIKSNGEFAYFAADIAYYWNKRHREADPADVAIYMLGADHHGYIGRMMAMCAAFGDEPGVNMQILIGQMVNVMKDGKAVRMSKRAGNVVTIDDLTEAIGVDAARYSLARTDYNSPVDIDLNLLASHSNENPVYYVQYAHARSKNVDRNAAAAGISYEGADLSLLDTEADGEVLAALAQFPSVLATAADDRQPHKVARYLEELAATYHKWYNVERVVPMALTEPEERLDDAAREAVRIAKNPEPARAAARLKLNDAVRTVIESGLDLLGVTAPDKM